MKLNKNVVKAVKPATKSPVKAKVAQAIALLTGARGMLARLVETHTTKEGVSIRAMQSNIGLPLKGEFAKVTGGKLDGKKQSRLELGGYVNGKSTGAKVTLITPAQFDARSKPCIVHWSADDKGIQGRYLGNPNVKGLVAVKVVYNGKPFFWQMEQDSNSHNKHERGRILPVKKGAKLLATA